MSAEKIHSPQPWQNFRLTATGKSAATVQVQQPQPTLFKAEIYGKITLFKILFSLKRYNFIFLTVAINKKDWII